MIALQTGDMIVYLRSLMAVDEIPYAPTSQESQVSDTR